MVRLSYRLLTRAHAKAPYALVLDELGKHKALSQQIKVFTPSMCNTGPAENKSSRIPLASTPALSPPGLALARSCRSSQQPP
jgi:hypothetical protein